MSFFTDVSSEMLYPLVPLFLTGVLGADKTLVGLIEGIAEATASLTKLGSGWLADRLGRVKFLVGLGYGISAAARPLMALAASPWHVLALRFADRLGKGVRTAPRDALLVATALPGQVGWAFGLHRALDQTGAILGPGLAFLLLAAFAGQFQPVFLIAALPGLLSVWLVWARVPEIPPPARSGRALPELRWASLDRRFKLYVMSSFILGVASASNAFLVLRCRDLGVPEALVPLVYMLYNVVYVAVSVPAGILSDRIGRPRLLGAGMAMFAAVYLGFGAAWAPWQAWVLFAAYGLYSGLTEGVARAWVGDLAPEGLRGSAFGIYHLAIGIAALPASLLTGWLWERFGPRVAFYTDTALALVALAVFLASLWPAGLAGRGGAQS